MEDSANYMSSETFDRVLKAIPQLKIRKWIDKDVEMMFKIAYQCSLRPSEAIFLKKEDFRLGRRELYLGKTKTKKSGEYTIIPLLFVQELEVYLKNKPSGRILPGLTYDASYHWMKRLGILLDIPAWTTPQSESGEKTVGHIMRKTKGKDYFWGLGDTDQVDIVTIQNIMRHKDIGMTVNNYLKLDKENIKQKI